jgi:hypothetical protein
MHSLRSSIRAREAGAEPRPLSLEERRREELAAAPETLPKGERRTGVKRRADRHRGVVEQAAILYRGKRAMVPVANVSAGGATLECGLSPEPGESLLIELPGRPPVAAVVRWVRKGRIGLALEEAKTEG